VLWGGSWCSVLVVKARSMTTASVSVETGQRSESGPMATGRSLLVFFAFATVCFVVVCCVVDCRRSLRHIGVV